MDVSIVVLEFADTAKSTDACPTMLNQIYLFNILDFTHVLCIILLLLSEN